MCVCEVNQLMEESCRSLCQGKVNGGGSLLEVRRESTVLPTHFPTERQHLAQLSRGPESKVQMIPMVNTLGDRRRTRRNFKN